MEPSRPASLLLVSSHRLFRERLAGRMNAGGEATVREVEDLEAAGAALAQAPADVVLADLAAPDEGRCGELRSLIDRFPRLRVIVLGGSESDEDYLRWVEAGAVGSVLRDSTLDELREAAERAGRGELHCPPEVGFRLFSRLGDLGSERRRRQRVEALSLSPRELEVLEMVADRMSNRQIAERLCLSVYTVKNHVQHILEKLEVRHRVQAVQRACENGWLRERRRELDAAVERRARSPSRAGAGDPASDAALRLFVVHGRGGLFEALSERRGGHGGLRVVGFAADASAAVERLRRVRADVVLVEAGGDRERGLERVGRLRESDPALKVLALGVAGVDDVVAFAEAGARACLPRDAAPDELTRAVRDLARRRTRCAPAVVARLIERIAARTREAAAAHHARLELTPREREVLRHLADGLTNKEIAQRLELAVATVKNHVHNLLGKLGVHRRQDAVRTAYVSGLIDDFLPRRPELGAVRRGPGGLTAAPPPGGGGPAP